MSLKSYLQALFKLSGSQAMPSSSVVELPLDNTDNFQSYVAPSDGFLAVLTSDADGKAECRNDSAQFVYSRSNGEAAAAFIPAAKGQSLQYRLSQIGSGYRHARFVKTGGAHSDLFVKG